MSASRTRCIPNPAARASSEALWLELIADRLRRARAQLEVAIVVDVSWFNAARLHSTLPDFPPVEFEDLAALRCKTMTGTENT